MRESAGPKAQAAASRLVQGEVSVPLVLRGICVETAEGRLHLPAGDAEVSEQWSGADGCLLTHHPLLPGLCGHGKGTLRES